MKRRLSYILIATMLLLVFISGCTAQQSSDPADKVYKLRLGTHYGEGHPALTTLENLKTKVAEETDGKIEITVYPASQLGDYTLTYEELMKGTVDMAMIPIPSQFDSKLEMNFIPYLMTDYSQAKEALGPDSYFFSVYEKIHSDLGVKLLGVYAEGFIGLGMTSLPEGYEDPTITKPLLVRAPNIEVYKFAVEDNGYNSTTIAYADLYSALQTGVCDGWIGGTPQLNYTGFRDVIEYYIPTNVFMENGGFFMSETVYEELPQEYQKIISDVFMEATLQSYQDAEKNDMDALKKLEEYGVEIVNLSERELEAFANHSREVTWPKLEDNIGAEVLQGLIDDLNK